MLLLNNIVKDSTIAELRKVVNYYQRFAMEDDSSGNGTDHECFIKNVSREARVAT